jgi:hypothetical protein
MFGDVWGLVLMVGHKVCYAKQYYGHVHREKL